MKWTIAIGAATLSSAAAAGPVEFYGVRVGEPPSIPQCQRKASTAAPAVCYERSSRGPMVTEPVSVRWVNEVPYVAAWPSFNALIVNGRVERIRMTTRGFDVQQAVFRQLIDKFGPPSTSNAVPMQNRLGARFDGIQANWVIGDVRVDFVGLDESLEHGEIRIDTEIGRAAMAARAAPARPGQKM